MTFASLPTVKYVWNDDSLFERQRVSVKFGSSGKSTSTLRWFWCVCDTCRVGTWVNAKDLDWKCTCKHVFASHPDEDACKNKSCSCERFVGDAAPGRSCRMSPKCPGKHRKGAP